jgi:hypothetical protein
MTNRTEQPSASRVLPFTVFALIAMCLPGAASAQWVTNGSNISNTNTGNVGVGTAAPATKLDVRGDFVLEAGRDPYLFTGTGTSDSYRYLQLLNSPGYRSATGLKVGGVLVSDTYDFANPGKNDLIVKGNVGVGTAAPSGTLHVRKDQAAFTILNVENQAAGGNTALIFIGSAGTQRGFIKSPTDSSSLTLGGGPTDTMTLTGGNVGIGTAVPAMKLDVRGDFVLEAGRDPYLFTGTGTSDAYRYLQLLNSPGYRSATGLKVGGVLVSDTYDFANPGKNDLIVKGNVGVGTAAPTTRLHVAGDIRVDGNINAKYQDVAEWVPSTQKLQAGTVVVLDPERANHVLASRGSYDTAVAGVISEKPGLSLGEAGEGKALVATTGRVKVRVDATRAPIKIGDLIVTSDVEGVAMKSEPVLLGGRRMHAPGTIIGKALEPLAAGTGEILVLLSLQ